MATTPLIILSTLSALFNQADSGVIKECRLRLLLESFNFAQSKSKKFLKNHANKGIAKYSIFVSFHSKKTERKEWLVSEKGWIVWK